MNYAVVGKRKLLFGRINIIINFAYRSFENSTENRYRLLSEEKNVLTVQSRFRLILLRGSGGLERGNYFNSPQQ